MTMDEQGIKWMQEKLEALDDEICETDQVANDCYHRYQALSDLVNQKRSLKHGLIESLEAMGVTTRVLSPAETATRAEKDAKLASWVENEARK